MYVLRFNIKTFYIPHKEINIKSKQKQDGVFMPLMKIISWHAPISLLFYFISFLACKFNRCYLLQTLMPKGPGMFIFFNFPYPITS